MGKSAINGNFQQQTVSLPEGIALAGARFYLGWTLHLQFFNMSGLYGQVGFAAILC